MDYREMTAPCGLDCFNCTFFLAPENPDTQAQIQKWSREYDTPLEIMQCRINKMGLEKWAESKASDVRNTYFNKPWSLAT